MSFPVHKFGQTTLAKVSDYRELRQLLDDPVFKSDTIIIKPNWVSADPADFTDAVSMRMLLEALDSKIVVTESHNFNRWLNLLEEEVSLTIENKNVDYKWFMQGDGWKWLVDNPGWEWFKKGGHWKQMKRGEKAFLDECGFTELFKEFGVTYLNVTDEVWCGRIADPAKVKSSVEPRFKPVQIEKLYSMVPGKLYDLRGSTFISLARLKMYASFTLKNMFGLIPDPVKPWWHGPKNKRIASSIIDINKVYHSLFNVYGICEAFNSMSVPHPQGKFDNIFMGRYNIEEGHGIVALGRDLLSLDAILLNLTDKSTLQSESVNIEPIDFAEEEFGAYDREVLKQSKIKVGDWFYP